MRLPHRDHLERHAARRAAGRAASGAGPRAGRVAAGAQSGGGTTTSAVGRGLGQHRAAGAEHPARAGQGRCRSAPERARPRRHALLGLLVEAAAGGARRSAARLGQPASRPPAAAPRPVPDGLGAPRRRRRLRRHLAPDGRGLRHRADPRRDDGPDRGPGHEHRADRREDAPRGARPAAARLRAPRGGRPGRRRSPKTEPAGPAPSTRTMRPSTGRSRR